MSQSNPASSGSADALQQSDGCLRHLLSLAELPRATLIALLDHAEQFLDGRGRASVRSTSLQGKTVANLFFEPSTRTRSSFELAAQRLGADVVNLDVNTSSRTKGETILDTVFTLQAMDIDVFVVRDGTTGTQSDIAAAVDAGVSIINAGESHVSHPTQGLLDLLTIRQHKKDFSTLKVAIVGDIAHSRVARSALHGLLKLGVGELRLVAPTALALDSAETATAIPMTDLEAGLKGVDVIMTLRIQKERFSSATDLPDEQTYAQRFGITADRLRFAADDVIVMHPGPFNRGVEISSEVADGPASVIWNQVANGVAVRMAVLDAIAGNGLPI